MNRRGVLTGLVSLAAAAALTSCRRDSSGTSAAGSDQQPGRSDATETTRSQSGSASTSDPAASSSAPPPVRPSPGWRPPDGEILPRAKQLAAEVAEILGGAGPGADAMALLRESGIPLVPASAGRTVPVPVGGWHMASPGAAAARYAQLGGLVPLATSASYASLMVLLEQQRDGGAAVVRTLDLRLRVIDGAWAVEEVASLGGDPVPRPADLPPAAAAVLDHPGIGLADSARWDIHAGRVDADILQVMARLGDRFSYEVTVLVSGHPRFVIDGQRGDRTSSHSRGQALDIWAVEGRSVREQAGEDGSPARQLLGVAAAELPVLAKIGVPMGWDVDGATSRLFDDPVHEDHVHLSLQ